MPQNNWIAFITSIDSDSLSKCSKVIVRTARLRQATASFERVHTPVSGTMGKCLLLPRASQKKHHYYLHLAKSVDKEKTIDMSP